MINRSPAPALKDRCFAIKMIMLSYHTWTLWFYVDWMNEVLIKEKKRKDDNQAMSVSVRSNRAPVHQRTPGFDISLGFSTTGGFVHISLLNSVFVICDVT